MKPKLLPVKKLVATLTVMCTDSCGISVATTIQCKIPPRQLDASAISLNGPYLFTMLDGPPGWGITMDGRIFNDETQATS